MARANADNPDVEAVNSGPVDSPVDPDDEPAKDEAEHEGVVITDNVANPAAAVADEEPEATVSTSSLSSDDKKLLGSFLKLSGYKRADILAWSNERRTVVVKNGSKYQVSRNGKQLKILTGAVPPSAETEV